MILATIPDSAAVFLSIVCILAVFGAIYLVYRSVVKEHKRYRDEVANYIEGVETKNEIIADVNAYISRALHAEFSILYVDIDKFTQVVENFGREESGRVIKSIATRLLEIMPSRVSLGRLKDDEFVVFTRGEFSREEVVKLAKKIVETISSPMKIYDESSLSLTCSVGISHYPAHGRSFKQLFDSCEIACYICKRNGGNQYRIYSKENSDDEATNMEYYYQIKEGIKNKEFDIYYQPMIDGLNGEIYAFEGLLRWNHPELGLLSPYKFINIMEQTGDINWVGLWGLETVIKQYNELKKYYSDKEFMMSLNLSPKQLSSPTLASDFQKIIKKYRGVQARNIILEIEEFAIFEKHEIIQNNMKSLSEIGFNIAVDGFGLDYKALKKLEEMSVDIVKLGREYLDDESDKYLKEKFIGILVDFSKNQDCTLICEGVEDENYLYRAKNLGLEIFQGYYFSKPMSSGEVVDFIKTGNWHELLNKKPTEDLLTEDSEENTDEKIVEEVKKIEEEIEKEREESTVSKLGSSKKGKFKKGKSKSEVEPKTEENVITEDEVKVEDEAKTEENVLGEVEPKAEEEVKTEDNVNTEDNVLTEEVKVEDEVEPKAEEEVKTEDNVNTEENVLTEEVKVEDEVEPKAEEEVKTEDEAKTEDNVLTEENVLVEEENKSTDEIKAYANPKEDDDLVIPEENKKTKKTRSKGKKKA